LGVAGYFISNCAILRAEIAGLICCHWETALQLLLIMDGRLLV
jgi:hypothetical protein